MKQIDIKLEFFEGPLELLLHLIEKNEIDIYNIPIATLTEQYMDYIDNVSKKDIDELSDFLVMASTLLEIKSKMLLPSINKNIETDEDPRAELVKRLIEYKKFKKITEELKERQVYAETYLFGTAQKDIIDSLKSRELLDFSEILKDVTVAKLFNIFQSTIERQESKVDIIRNSFNSVKKDTYTVEEKISYIKNLLNSNEDINFFSILSGTLEKIEIVVTFLAILELVKMKKIIIVQNEIFEDIFIRKQTCINNTRHKTQTF